MLAPDDSPNRFNNQYAPALYPCTWTWLTRMEAEDTLTEAWVVGVMFGPMGMANGHPTQVSAGKGKAMLAMHCSNQWHLLLFLPTQSVLEPIYL